MYKGDKGNKGPAGIATTQAWSSVVSGAPTALVLAGALTPDGNITITRIQAVAQTAPAGCSSPAVILVTDGSATRHDAPVAGGRGERQRPPSR